MSTTLSTIRVTLAIPHALWHAWGGPSKVQEQLALQGLWPTARVQQQRWRMDYETQRYIADLEVAVSAATVVHP